MGQAWDGENRGRASEDHLGANILGHIEFQGSIGEAVGAQSKADSGRGQLRDAALIRVMVENLRHLATELIGRLDETQEALSRPEQGQPIDSDPPRPIPVNCAQRGQSAPISFPDPQSLRLIIRQRQLRARYFKGDLFADPAWDMLLDLAVARAEERRVSVTSLSIASGVPPTTALRWIGQLVEEGLFERIDDDLDRRRAFIVLSDQGAEAIARYFADIGKDCALLT